MATKLNRLSARTVASSLKPGRHADGGNLYLNVTATGAKSWVFFYKIDGRQREMGLGSASDISLAKARELAVRHRQALATGNDPMSLRDVPKAPTFGAVADAYIEAHKSAWSNEKHIAQWEMTLKDYAAPLRPMRVDRITTEDVLKVLKPIWQTKPETASRLRGRIESVLNAAAAKGQRSGENPARWVGNLKDLLPACQKLSRGHHAALPRKDLPGFMAALRDLDGISPRALEFTILTATRSGEVRGARWSEIDLETGIWAIPAERMKARAVHRVPLSAQAAAILKELAKARISEFVFPGTRAASSLSVMALDMVLRRMKAKVTVHGFRSTFRDWAAEETNFSRDVCEMALAHTVSDKVEAAYRRGDLFDKRRKLMEAWAQYCEAKTGKVVSMARAAR
jgi:integrase